MSVAPGPCKVAPDDVAPKPAEPAKNCAKQWRQVAGKVVVPCILTSAWVQLYENRNFFIIYALFK